MQPQTLRGLCLHIMLRSLSLIEQKIVLSMFVRRFNPRDVLKTDIKIQEAITALIDDPVEVRVDLAAELTPTS